MKPLSSTILARLEGVRNATSAAPLLRFELDPQPSETANGWRIGRRRDGTALVVTPTRRAMMLEGSSRVAFYDWLRRELEAAADAARSLSDEDALALVGAPSTMDELVTRLGGAGQPLTTDDLLHDVGAWDDLDPDLDEAPALADWLPEGMSESELEGARPVCRHDRSMLLLSNGGFIEIDDAHVSRLTLREASLRHLARPHLDGATATAESLAKDTPEPWSEWGVVLYLLLLSPFVGLGSLVAGCAIAAVVAVVGLFLTESGVQLPDAPSAAWLIGVPSSVVFLIASVLIARHGGD
ncbi:MAG: hypothetical protein JJ863_26090 [Deltaproteobacteria bacterium]|nr:hypothetical protein [Deltaproteobacteria bacterium]